jgi:hypothetical protein
LKAFTVALFPYQGSLSERIENRETVTHRGTAIPCGSAKLECALRSELVHREVAMCSRER